MHRLIAWIVVVGNGICGVWALLAHWLAPFRRTELWWAVIAAQILVFVQVGLGVWNMAIVGIEPPGMHTFYGFLMIFAVLIAFGYSRTSVRAYLYQLYGFGCLFMMGLGIRAMYLG